MANGQAQIQGQLRGLDLGPLVCLREALLCLLNLKAPELVARITLQLEPLLPSSPPEVTLHELVG